MQKIIGVCGLIGTGKGTVSDILVKEHNFKKIAFADKLKDGVATIFGWDRALLEGDTKESREWREQKDVFWSRETNKEITPRLVLQLFGTDCVRNGFYDGTWVSLVKKEILDNPDTNYIISDARFPNELDLVRSLGGEIWCVRRGELPEWWDCAVETNIATEDNEWIIYDEGNHMETAYPDIHVSEWKWAMPDSQFSHIFYNTGTIDELKTQVLKALHS